MSGRCLAFLACTALVACGGDPPVVPDAGSGFVCLEAGDSACVAGAYHLCVAQGVFLREDIDDCPSRGEVCLPERGCAKCVPSAMTCRDGDAYLCDALGETLVLVEACGPMRGCRNGTCQDLCAIARSEASYVGCEFFAVDLDNYAAIGDEDASAQQFAVVVSNTARVDNEVTVEMNDAPFGSPASFVEVARVVVPSRDLETIRLPRREVDGSSSNARCTPAEPFCTQGEVCDCLDAAGPCFCHARAGSMMACSPVVPPAPSPCPSGELCFCPGGGQPCACRTSGVDDGTHSALTSRAFRIRSQYPVVAYQFNPLDNVSVFSNDASLLLPTTGLSDHYTVVGWPQTIAPNECADPESGCDCAETPSACIGSPFFQHERGFLTVVGSAASTTVRVTLGSFSRTIVGAPGIPAASPSEVVEVTLGPLDVLNLETNGFNADFTGTIVEATAPVAVFTGSEVADAPSFTNYGDRQCCGDHIEEQLFGDEALGSTFVIARMPMRAPAINEALDDPSLRIPEIEEPFYVRVLAPLTRAYVTTSLPPPDNRFALAPGEARMIAARQDFELSAEGAPLTVLHTMASQRAAGVIASGLPGGDPSILAVPPNEQFRRDYIFLVPDSYAFDFLVITADRGADIRLEGASIFAPPLDLDGFPRWECVTSPADGIARDSGDPPPAREIHRCQLSFPEVRRVPDTNPIQYQIVPARQHDGTYELVADSPIGIAVYGFDRFVSYAYAGGLDLRPVIR